MSVIPLSELRKDSHRGRHCTTKLDVLFLRQGCKKMNLFLAKPVYFLGLKKGPGGGQFWPKPRRIRWLPRCRYERQRPERALPLRVLRASQPVNLAPQV